MTTKARAGLGAIVLLLLGVGLTLILLNDGVSEDKTPLPPQEAAARSQSLVEGLTEQYNREFVKQCEQGKREYQELYHAMADIGLLGIGVPEVYGGAGGGLTASSSASARSP